MNKEEKKEFTLEDMLKKNLVIEDLNKQLAELKDTIEQDDLYISELKRELNQLNELGLEPAYIKQVIKENEQLKAKNKKLEKNIAILKDERDVLLSKNADMEYEMFEIRFENRILLKEKEKLKEKDEDVEKYKDFAKFVTNALFDDWNKFSEYDELFCRKLINLGLIKYSKNKKYYQPAIKLDGDMVVQYCKKIKVELEENLKANTHQVCEKIRSVFSRVYRECDNQRQMWDKFFNEIDQIEGESNAKNGN